MEADIILTRTKRPSFISEAYLANPTYLRFNMGKYQYDSFLSNDNRHMHFVNSDRLEIGDYCIGDGVGYQKEVPMRVKDRFDDNHILVGETKLNVKGLLKMVATSDETLPLHFIPTEFLKLYCENNSHIKRVEFEIVGAYEFGLYLRGELGYAYIQRIKNIKPIIEQNEKIN